MLAGLQPDDNRPGDFAGPPIFAGIRLATPREISREGDDVVVNVLFSPMRSVGNRLINTSKTPHQPSISCRRNRFIATLAVRLFAIAGSPKC